MTATATNTKNSKTGAEAPPPGAATEIATAVSGKGEPKLHKVELDRPSFKPALFLSRKPGSLVETYEGPACEGHVAGHVEMPESLDEETGELRKWFCYVIELTKPTKADNRGAIVDLKAGEQVLVAENAQLRQAIPAAVANHPTHMLYVKIVPIERKPMPDDAKKQMWKIDILVGDAPVPRRQALSGNSVIASMLASAKTAQLAG